VDKEHFCNSNIYFFLQKAIEEHGSEWAQNRKLLDLSKKDIRHSVPKGFPYFAVDFGLQAGYAHVIEDENVSLLLFRFVSLLNYTIFIRLLLKFVFI
jgi:hypothetical protein